MVRSVTVFDPDYTEDDMAAALDWLGEKANECPGCHLPLDETTAADREDVYHTDLVRCHSCASRESAFRAHGEAGGDTAGLLGRIWEGSVES